MSKPNPKRQSRFSSDVATLVTGTTIAQFITILASPIITRLYGPEAFGLLALFTSITGIIVVIACLRYELSIMLPESNEDAINLLGLCIIIVTVISLLTLPVIWFGQEKFCQLLNAPNLAPFLWFVPPFVLISGIFLALNYWNSRTKHFRRLSIARVTSSVATTGTQISAGFSGFTGGGSLIGASVLGHFVATFILAFQILRDDYRLIKKSLNFNRIRDGFTRYKKFPLIDTFSSLLNTISWQLPVFLLAAFFSPIIVGYYALGFRILQLPMSFIGNSISQVFFQRATEARRDGTLANLVENVFKILIMIGLFPILILTFIGKDIFSLVFGSVWAEAGIYTQILSIWALVWFISSPLSMLYIVLEKQEFGLKYNIANFFTRLGSLLIGGFLGDPIIALGLFAGSGIVVYGYLGHTMLEYSQVKRSRYLKIIISNILMFIPVGIVLSVMKGFEVSSMILVITATIFCLIYYVYIIKTDSQIKTLLMTFTS